MNKYRNVDKPNEENGRLIAALKRKKILALAGAVVALALVIIVSVTLAQNDTVRVAGNEKVEIACEGRGIHIQRISRTRVVLHCKAGRGQPTATAVPDDTPAPPPTETAPPEETPEPPTATAVPPTATPDHGDHPPSPTPPPGGGRIEPYPSAPACPPELHNPHEWHGIWNYEHGCHYDHEHGDDPSQLDHLFGPLGAEWGGNGLDHVFSTDGEHNDFKHRTHKVTVRRNLPCVPVNAQGCVTDLRMMQHLDFFNMTTRFHSFWLEARVCSVSNPNDCGIVKRGGWLDFGPLINQTTGRQVPVPDDALFPFRSTNRRLHRPDNTFSVWYGMQFSSSYDGRSPGLGNIQIGSEVSHGWTYLDPNNPSNQIFHCENGSCRYNSSNRQQGHLVDFRLNGQLFGSRANASGFTDVYGIPNSSCTAAGPNCVPYSFENVRTDISYQHRDDAHGLRYRSYDVHFNGNTSSPSGWIKFPN